MPNCLNKFTGIDFNIFFEKSKLLKEWLSNSAREFLISLIMLPEKLFTPKNLENAFNGKISNKLFDKSNSHSLKFG